MNSSSLDPLQFQISGESAQCEEVRARGFNYFDQLAEHVRLLPYGRTASNEDPCAALREGHGTCSSKHQLLAAVAQDCGRSEIQLTVGIYEMSEANTPGVGTVLSAACITSIPEAHCYLTVGGKRLDFTGLASGKSSPFESLFVEQVAPVSGLAKLKVRLHKEALASWAGARGVSLEVAWATREACIAALAPCIFRPSPLSGDGLIEFDLSGGGQRLRCAPPRSVSEFRGQCVKPDTPMSMQLAG